MFTLWLGLNIAIADDFAITEIAQLNPHQQHFIATVNQNRVRYKEGLQRYKSRTYKHHWTYSRGKTYSDIEQKLQTAANTDVFYLEEVEVRSIRRMHWLSPPPPFSIGGDVRGVAQTP